MVEGVQPTLDGRLRPGYAAAAAARADCMVAPLSEDLGSEPDVCSAGKSPGLMLAPPPADDGLLTLKDIAATRYG